MVKPNLQQLNEIRKQGLRPGVAACFVSEKKVLMLYKKKHDLWQLPQGGVDNKETIEKAFLREMIEEVGIMFLKSCAKEIKLLGEDQVLFPPETQNKRNLKTDQGEEIFMRGKKYFFVAAKARAEDFDIQASAEFDDCGWFMYDQAIKVAETIYQQGKKRVTLRVLELLREGGYL